MTKIRVTSNNTLRVGDTVDVSFTGVVADFDVFDECARISHGEWHSYVYLPAPEVSLEKHVAVSAGQVYSARHPVSLKVTRFFVTDDLTLVSDHGVRWSYADLFQDFPEAELILDV